MLTIAFGLLRQFQYKDSSAFVIATIYCCLRCFDDVLRVIPLNEYDVA